MYKNQHSLIKITDFSLQDVKSVFALADLYATQNNMMPLMNKIALNLFFENSTRTLASFELAEKSLGAKVITLPITSSSIAKGESLIDTVKTLNKMQPDFMIVRHYNSGAVELIAQNVSCCVINAGDGSHEHPSQALIDGYTILHFKKNFSGLTVAICGDVLHSRVARSNIVLLQKLGAKIVLVAPPTLVRDNFLGINAIFHRWEPIISECDVIMMLRMQKERMNKNAFIPSEREYFKLYGLDNHKLSMAKPDVLVMHPGPMNQGIEIDHKVASSSPAILKQVEFGVAIRKAILHHLSG